jgi:3-phenylpropionate/trans-cinnamate dioxygenase ferredoxin component
MSPQPACTSSDVAAPGALAVRLVDQAGAEVAVAVVRDADGAWYAVSDTCSHGRVSLSEGEVEGCSIECWMHGSAFDLRTGRPLNLPAVSPIPVYPVTIDGDHVLVDVDAPSAV